MALLSISAVYNVRFPFCDCFRVVIGVLGKLYCGGLDANLKLVKSEENVH